MGANQMQKSQTRELKFLIEKARNHARRKYRSKRPLDTDDLAQIAVLSVVRQHQIIRLPLRYLYRAIHTAAIDTSIRYPEHYQDWAEKLRNGIERSRKDQIQELFASYLELHVLLSETVELYAPPDSAAGDHLSALGELAFAPGTRVVC
jgi:hypothetical protein